MTVRINKPALNLREELTKAQSVVPYVQQQFWMDGLVENGTFDSDTAWTKGAGWTISGGQAVQTGTASNNIYQNGVTEDGKNYLITVNVLQNDGSCSLRTANGATIIGSVIDTTGLFSFVFTASGTRIDFRSGFNTANVIIDDIKVFEVDENDEVIHSLPLGWKPLHVYEDGLIQREGDVHDYTVVKTGGAYAIKPAVQPTATTETCVIAEREL